MPSHYFSLLTSISEINDYLCISGFAPVREDNLRRLGITCVVDATNVPKKPLDYLDYIKVTVDDHECAQLNVHFDRVADKVHEHRCQGGKTLVHCAAGISRSAALCMVYLMKHENMTLKDAYLRVLEKRRIISPNTGFWKQMIDYELSIRSMNTVKLIKTKYRQIPDIYLPNKFEKDKENEHEIDD